MTLFYINGCCSVLMCDIPGLKTCKKRKNKMQVRHLCSISVKKRISSSTYLLSNKSLFGGPL